MIAFKKSRHRPGRDDERNRKEADARMTPPWTIALFAGLAERFGSRQLVLDRPETEMTAGRLKAIVCEQYPDHAEAVQSAFVACNQAFARDEAIVKREDELALLPPVSGGSGDEGAERGQAFEGPRYEIVEGPIDIDAVSKRARHPDHGALLAFVGTTREWTHGKRTVLLEYEAYAPMAIAAMRQIGKEIGERWPGTITSITHRIGPVGIGDASVVIAVSSAHRAEAYEASRHAIERLKTIVPIWKKEVYEDGTEWKGHQLGPWDPLAPIT